MRALQFKINLDSLVLKDWNRWSDKDKKHIGDLAEQNKLRLWYDEKYDEMGFEGKQTNLFFFLHDLSYRYDIELI